MALIDKLTAIADAIRAKTGESGTMTLAQMPGKIAGISGDGGAYNIVSEADGDGNQILQITDAGGTPPAPVLETVTVTPTESAQTVTPSEGYDGIGEVDVAAIQANYVGSGVTRAPAATITPGDTEQTAAASGVYTTGAIKVAAVPSATYIKRSQVAEVSTVSDKPADGTGKNGDLFIKVVV